MELSGVKPDPHQQSNRLPPGGGLGGTFGQALFLSARGWGPEFCANDLFRCDRSTDLSLCFAHSMRWRPLQ